MATARAAATEIALRFIDPSLFHPTDCLERARASLEEEFREQSLHDERRLTMN
jgi:hypothetical protein